MKAKDLAKELAEMEFELDILKKLVNKCQKRFKSIKEQRYPKGGMSEQNYKDIFKEVDKYFGSVVRHLMHLDNKFNDFSHLYREIINDVLEEQNFNFRV